jgi:hypothetical protein
MSKNKTPEEIRLLGKKFLDELKVKGPKLDSVGKTVVRINTSNNMNNDLDEPLSESRKLRKLRIEIDKEFGKNKKD